MKSFIRKFLSVMIICSMTFVSLGITAFAGPVSAASKPVLSKKTVTVKKGKSTTIRLKNAGKKVVWKSSNKKIVRIVKTKGKYRSTVTIRGLKKGKAYVTAKLGKKSYRCKVTVTNKKPGSQPVPGPEEEIEILPLSDSSEDLTELYTRNTAGNSNADEAFCSAVTDCSIELFRKVSAKETSGGNNGSVLVSPDSIETALAMLENGAAGNTLNEMGSVLGGGMDREAFCSYLAGMNDRLERSDKIIFQQSNSIWARKGLMDVSERFLQQNKDYFDSQFYVAPFSTETVSDINNWVYNNTRNMIRNILDRLTDDDRMVLINTIAFEGKWAVPFESVTDETFTNAEGAAENASMLKELGSCNYFSLNGAKCFERRYKGGEISFVGILPPEGTTADAFVRGMSGSDFRSAWKKRKMEHVDLTMPEFKYDYGTELQDVLKDMGMEEAFSAAADFSAMGEPSVMVDRVIHKTHIELDRNGTKAAAATAVVAKESSAYMESPIEIRMDRPFVYALVDNETGIPLFIGSVKTLK